MVDRTPVVEPCVVISHHDHLDAEEEDHHLPTAHDVGHERDEDKHPDRMREILSEPLNELPHDVPPP